MNDPSNEKLLSIKLDIERAIGRNVMSIAPQRAGDEVIVNVQVNFNSVSKPFPETIQGYKVKFENISPSKFN